MQQRTQRDDKKLAVVMQIAIAPGDMKLLPWATLNQAVVGWRMSLS